jgi:ankyrin repeat protein
MKFLKISIFILSFLSPMLLGTLHDDLTEAIKNGDIDSLNKILEGEVGQTPKINFTKRTKLNRTYLHEAVLSGNVDVLEKVLEKALEQNLWYLPNFTDDSGFTPLEYAVTKLKVDELQGGNNKKTYTELVDILAQHSGGIIRSIIEKFNDDGIRFFYLNLLAKNFLLRGIEICDDGKLQKVLERLPPSELSQSFCAKSISALDCSKNVTNLASIEDFLAYLEIPNIRKALTTHSPLFDGKPFYLALLDHVRPSDIVFRTTLYAMDYFFTDELKEHRTIFFSMALGNLVREDKRCFKLMGEIINMGADVNFADENGDTVLHKACSTGEVTFKYGWPIINTTMGKYIYCPNPGQFRYLLEQGARITANNEDKFAYHLLEEVSFCRHYFAGYSMPHVPEGQLQRDIDEDYMPDVQKCIEILLEKIIDE